MNKMWIIVRVCAKGKNSACPFFQDGKPNHKEILDTFDRHEWESPSDGFAHIDGFQIYGPFTTPKQECSQSS
jgi:hypothetical protein